MNETFSNLLGAASNRSVTVRSPEGRPMVRLKLLHAAGIAAAGVLMAPRLTAVAAVGALFKGVSLSLDETIVEAPAA
jgi:hypothetical protein